jgi:hypothetical protein
VPASAGSSSSSSSSGSSSSGSGSGGHRRIGGTDRNAPADDLIEFATISCPPRVAAPSSRDYPKRRWRHDESFLSP